MTNTRKNISEKDIKILFALSRNECAFPGCNQKLVEPDKIKKENIVIGEMAHIIAAKRQGPRGNHLLTDDELSSHKNLILLCPRHHKIIDDLPKTYSIPVLLQMKSDHENKSADIQGYKQEIESINEEVYSSLLPVTHFPQAIFSADTTFKQGKEETINQLIAYPSERNKIIPYIIRERRIYTFIDLRNENNPFSESIDNNTVQTHRYEDFISNFDGRVRLINLLNQSLSKYLSKERIFYDKDHSRYYFAADKHRIARNFKYQILSGRSQNKDVVWQPHYRRTGEPKSFWFHMAASLKFHMMSPSEWCLSIRPERHITKDGNEPIASHLIGRKVTRIKAKMYNDKYLSEVNFWRDYLLNGQPRIIIDFMDQALIIEGEFIKLEINWPTIFDKSMDIKYKMGEDDLFSAADLNAIESAEEIDMELWEETALEDELDD